MEYLNLSFLSVLKKTLNNIFDTVLSPVITEVTKALLKLAGSLLTEIFANFILRIFITLLKLVDFLESIFNIFSGISPIKYQGKTTYFLDLFFNLGSVKTAFLLITVIAAAAAFLCSMYAAAKSISDMALEEKNPISTVLKNAAKSMLAFLLIPLFSLFLLQLSSVLTSQINTVFIYADHSNAKASMGDILFITAACEAKKSEGALATFSSEKQYEDLDAVKSNFNIEKINYVVAFAGSILVCFIMLGAILLFIRRLFEVLILYLSSPFFVSAIPADGGILFGKWRDLFVAKIFSGFGSVFSMKLYFLLSPALVGEEIVFSQDTGLNYCMQLFIVIGGAWAVYKGQHLILELLNPEAAAAAQQSAAGIMALAVGASSLAKGGISKIAGGKSSKISPQNAPASGTGLQDGQQEEKDEKEDEQVFTGR